MPEPSTPPSHPIDYIVIEKVECTCVCKCKEKARWGIVRHKNWSVARNDGAGKLGLDVDRVELYRRGDVPHPLTGNPDFCPPVERK